MSSQQRFFGDLQWGDRFQLDSRYFVKETDEEARLLRDEHGDAPLDPIFIRVDPEQMVLHLRRRSADPPDP